MSVVEDNDLRHRRRYAILAQQNRDTALILGNLLKLAKERGRIQGRAKTNATYRDSNN